MTSATVTVASPVAVTGTTTSANSLSLLQKFKGKCVSGGLQCIMSIPEFAKVPAAFALKYNRSAQKVSGLNMTSGVLETLKSLPKAAQWLLIPAIITGAATGLGPIAATLATALGFAIPMGTSELLSKLFPHEEDVIAQVCKEKGIDITKPDGTPDIRKPEGVLA